MDLHPDFEALSAHHDGEAPEWADHVAACPACRRQLDELAATSAAVAGAWMAPAAAGTADPVARAVAAVESGEPAAGLRGPNAGTGLRGPNAGTGLRGPNAGTGLRGPNAGTGQPRRFSSRGWVAVASVAAVALAGIAGVTVASRDGRNHSDTTAAVDQPVVGSGPPSAETAPALPGAKVGTGSDVVSGGDLGDIPDVAALVARAGPAARRAQAGPTRDARPRPTPPPGPAGSTLPPGPAGRAGVPAPRIVGTRFCETEARAATPSLGEVVYAATGRHQGEAVVVLGFAAVPRGSTLPPEPAGSVNLEVRAQDGCRLLLEATVP